MIASVQYNDLRGTVAADISDFYQNSLQTYLKVSFKSYDADRYYCNGCKVWISGQGDIRASIDFICWDNENERYVCFSQKNDCSLTDIFSLFKRFEMVMGVDINEVEIDDQDYLDLD